MLLWQLMFTEVIDYDLGPDPSDTTQYMGVWIRSPVFKQSSRPTAYS